MKIVVAHHHPIIVGGAEFAVRNGLSELVARGRQVVFVHEDPLLEGTPLAPPRGVKSLQISPGNEAAILAELRAWQPTVILDHGLHEARYLALLQSIAPVVTYVHDYNGSCVSGTKLHMFPTPTPCTRKVGLGCLAYYLPRRCGGLNPATMMKMYLRTRDIRKVLMENEGIILSSAGMVDEWKRLDYPADRLHVVWPYCGEPPAGIDAATFTGKILPEPGAPIRIMYLGRMVPAKGGGVLLEAVQTVRRTTQRPVHLTMAGDGPLRPTWQQMAGRAMAADPQLTIEFAGHVDAAQRSHLLAQAHLFVMPSIWPEPFGQVGVQALLAGVPTVAFDSGGVREWLQPGVNGRLAGARPPSADNLANAIREIFVDGDRYRQMSAAGPRTATRFKHQVHFDRVDAALMAAVQSPRRSRG